MKEKQKFVIISMTFTNGYGAMRINSFAKYGVLLEVAECGSISAAAVRLGYTQSAVSRMIAELEAECGFQLIKRSKSGSQLTAEGLMLISPIRNMLNANERLAQTIEQINGRRRDRVRVGMFSSVAVHWAPELIGSFNAEYPDIEVSIFDGLYHEIESKILSGELDCGFITEKTKKDLAFCELSRDRLLAVVPKVHALAERDALPLELIPMVDFIIPGEGSNYDIGTIFEEHGINPRVRYAFCDDHAAVAMVERGMGVTILPELVLSGSAANVITMPLDPPFSRTIGIAHAKQKALSPAAKAFTEFVIAWAEKR